CQGRNRHKDHQQHKQDINERSNVDIRFSRDLFLCFFHRWSLLLSDLVVDTFSQQTDLIDACVPNVVHDLNNIAVLCAKVAFDEDALFQLARQNVIHFRSDVINVDLVRSQVEFAVSRDGNNNGIVSIGFFHVDWIPCFGELDALALLQHWSDNHENDQKDKHHVRHRRNVDVGGDSSCTSA